MPASNLITEAVTAITVLQNLIVKLIQTHYKKFEKLRKKKGKKPTVPLLL